MTLERIEKLCGDYDAALSELDTVCQTAEAEIAAVKREHMKVLLKRVKVTRNAAAALRREIEANPALFDRPKTRTFNNVRVGYRKGSGKIELGDEGKVVTLIRKHLPDQAGLLIKTVESPVKKAMTGLSATDLKRIGVTIADATDEVVIKPMDGSVEKLAAALLGEDGGGS